MCGILGTVDTKITSKQIKKSLELIKHRGPDEFIYEEHAQLKWGMTRLSIRDITPNMYPFRFKNLRLIFNGEIYNTRQLKKVLSSLGFKTKTDCDAELILPLFYHFGSKAFSMLRGMFSIAIYDQEKERLYLARDQFGEKPLYYYMQHKNFFFASELKAFPKKYKSIALNSVQESLYLGFTTNGKTMFRNIKKLLPGELLTYEINSGVIKSTMFNSFSKNINMVTSKTVSNLDILLRRIVNEKLAADVPVGVFLSGGLDSSLLLALVAEKRRSDLFTYSVGFLEQAHDESQYSSIVSSKFNTNHTHLLLTENDAKMAWESVLKAVDEPICDPALIPTYLLSQKASDKVKVVITGEGADEIFAGYERYKKEYLASLLRKFLPLNKEGVKQWRTLWRVFSEIDQHYHSISYSLPWMLGSKNQVNQFEKIINQSWQHIQKSENVILSMQLYDLMYYVADQLTMKNDKMMMHHSIESRAPYLDTRLLPYMALSSSFVKKGFGSKFLLRKVGERYLPPTITNRKKHGFSLPIEKWLRGAFASNVENLIKKESALYCVIGKSDIKKTVNSFKSHNKNSLMIWNMITLHEWLQQN